MTTLHNYGLVRFDKKSGKIDTTMTALGKGLLQMWALKNTPKNKACVIIDTDDRKVFAEYIGTEDGFPEIRKTSNEFEFDLPDQLWDVFSEEVAKPNPPQKYEVKASVLDCKKIDTAIERAKKELAKQKMHENFGQEYIRAIRDKFEVGLSYNLEDKMNMSKLEQFEHWCNSYTPQQEKQKNKDCMMRSDK